MDDLITMKAILTSVKYARIVIWHFLMSEVVHYVDSFT